MNIGLITDCGKVRRENQDRCLALERTFGSESVVLCVVADGMGGTGDGGMASDYVVRRLQGWWEQELPGLLERQPMYAYLSQSLDELLDRCSREIFRHSRQVRISTGTTCSLLFACRGQALIKHVGDSRIYLKRDGEWLLLTRDHTWEQQELSEGRDPRADADYARKKGALVNAMGAVETCGIDTQMLQLAAGDCFLVCSDGFYRYLSLTEDMCQVGEEAQQVLEGMAEAIRTTPAADNFTAVLAINGESEAGGA